VFEPCCEAKTIATSMPMIPEIAQKIPEPDARTNKNKQPIMKNEIRTGLIELKKVFFESTSSYWYLIVGIVVFQIALDVVAKYLVEEQHRIFLDKIVNFYCSSYRICGLP
jgi:hypothetical protein